jgi:hypothetical protein
LSDDLIEELEIEACGLDAKITQLLKWGALLLQELESCTVRKNQVTLQIKTLTGEEEPLDTWRDDTGGNREIRWQPHPGCQRARHEYQKREMALAED